MSSAYSTSHQYEPLRTPSGWSEEERKLIVQLTGILDDLYARFNRLRFEDFGSALKSRIEDDEGNIATLEMTTEGMAAAVNNNRLAFSANGLEIKNAAGVTVFAQDNATGDLTITGRIAASGGTIGGFTIGANALHNGTSIVLSANGYVQLGDLTVTDDASFGPILEAVGGLVLRVGSANYLVLGEGVVSAQFPLSAKYGLYTNPYEVTANAPNAYIDPSTGKMYRSLVSAGGTGSGSSSAVAATLTLGRTAMTLGQTLSLTGLGSGGVAPYTYAFAVSYGGGAYTVISGSGSGRNYTPAMTGAFRFQLTVTDSQGSSDTVYSSAVLVSQTQSSLSAWVSSSKSSLTGGGSVTWTAGASGGSGNYTYSIVIYKDNSYFASSGDSSVTRTLSDAGSYYAAVQVVDVETLQTHSITGGNVTVGQTTQYAVTTGSSVRIRSGPGTGYSIVATVPNSGSYVQITGGYTGGWYPVYWNGYSGYMSAEYLSLR